MAASKLTTSIKEDFLSCALCLELFRDPVSMNCLHTFCTECLSTYAENNQIKSGQILRCPVCRMPMTLPADGIKGLNKNHWIKNLAELVKETTLGSGLCIMCKDKAPSVIHCLDCASGLCQKCKDCHLHLTIFEKHHLITYDELKEGKFVEECKAMLSMCDQHRLIKDVYCKHESCKRTMCLKCKVLHHEGHQAISVEEQVNEDKTTLQKLSDDMKAAQTKLENELQKGETEQSHIISREDKIIKCIKDVAEKMKSCIDKEAERLVKETKEISQKDKDEVSALVMSVKKQIKRNRSAIQITENLLLKSSHEAMMCVTPKLVDECENLKKTEVIVWKRKTDIMLVPASVTVNMLKAEGAIGSLKVIKGCPFQIGDKVKVKAEIKKPKYGWGYVTHKSIGIIQEINGDELKIAFQEYARWKGLCNEIMFAE